MKKLLGMLGLVLGLGAVAFAGTPQEQPLPGQIPYSNTTISVSTFSTASNVNLSMTLAPGTLYNGVSASCRNCFTNWFVEIPTTTVVSFLDLSSGTTFYTIDGQGLASSGVNALSSPRDHLGPLCGSAGHSTQINLVNTTGVSTNHQLANVEGYTQCGQINQGGLMQ